MPTTGPEHPSIEELQRRAVADLRAVSKQLGVTTLTGRAYNAARADGMVSSTTIGKRFGSWAAAVESAGLVPGQRGNGPAVPASPDVIVAGLKEVADGLGTTVLTARSYDRTRDPERLPSVSQIALRFGTWAQACSAAGLAPGGPGDAPVSTAESIVRDLRKAAKTLRVHTLSMEAYEEARRRRRKDQLVSVHTAIRRFGTWSAACQAAGLSSGPLKRLGTAA